MVILDVREKEEFEAEHIPESISCPLSQFDILVPGILKNTKDSEFIIMCRTGNRAKIALDELKRFSVDRHSFSVFDGGLIEWKGQGHTILGKGSVFPIMRQVQIVASSFIFIAFLASQFLAPDFIYLALFVGFGLALSGYAGICPIVYILQKMPWNNKKISNTKIDSNMNCCG
jgi:rhodanese-related sulfurtransferase